MNTPSGTGKLTGLYTIPSGVGFADSLAQGLLESFGDDALALTQARIYLPTRRACRSLQEAFLRGSGGSALLLPRLVPLGDLDAEDERQIDTGFAAGIAELEVPPAVVPLRRQLILMRLVERWGAAAKAASGLQVIGQEQAFMLAGELAHLIDQVETEGLSFERLAELVPDDYAAHWQLTLGFLEIVTHQWPKIEAELGAIGPAARRRRLAELQAAAWRASPTRDPVVIAGSTGTIPATAQLIAAALELPCGLVVLPGLDQDSAPEVWRQIERDPVHPQHALSRLLRDLDRPRETVDL